MPDCGERPAEENERRLETASCRDPPPNNYGAQMLERSLPPQQQQQQQQQSGGRKKTGGIMRLPNYKGWIVEIRIPKWADHSKLWINSEDHEAAQYIADAAYCLTGQLPFHFPNVKFEYLPLRLSTGEELTTRVNCLAHVAKIAKGPALRSQRQDFKERAQKLILEMVKDPKVVQFLNIMRASPRPQANPDGTSSPFTDDENGTAMEVDTPSDEAIEALASTVAVNPSRCDSLVPVAEDTHSVKANDGEGENETPLEVDSLGEEAIQTLAPTGNQDAASLFQFDSTMTSFSMGVDWSSAFIPSFEMNLDEPENFLTSADLSLEIWHPRSGEKKEKEDLVPDNYKEFLASLDGYEEVCKSIGPPRAPFVPHSPLLATSPGSGW